jgi:hypothetical protein
LERHLALTPMKRIKLFSSVLAFLLPTFVALAAWAPPDPNLSKYKGNFHGNALGLTNLFRIMPEDSDTNSYMTVINAADYGITSSGNQTVKIQAALDAGSNKFCTVYIPHGTYGINGTLVVHPNTRVIGDSSRGTAGTAHGTTLYGNESGKIMMLLEGSGCEIANLSFLDDGFAFGTIGISSQTNVPAQTTQDYSIHDCSFKGLATGIKLQYTWGGRIQNNWWGTSGGCCIFATQQCNAFLISGNYFQSQQATNNITWWATAPDVSYGNVFIANEFENSSNNVWMAGPNSGFVFFGNYHEVATNCYVINGAIGPVIEANHTLNSPNGTNIILVSVERAKIRDNRMADPNHFLHADATSFGLDVTGNDIRSGGDYNFFNAQTFWFNDGTNTMSKGGFYTGDNIGTFIGNTGNQALPISTTSFYGPDANGITNIFTTDTSTVTRSIMPDKVKLSHLYVVASGNPGAVVNSVTVMTNGVASSITCTLNNVTTGNDATHSDTVIAGTEVGVKIITGAGSAVKWSWGFQAANVP